ncbi:hemin-degrading factor [Cerasicoccus frondis]|uniref:hemin-degrading factor n=1 Tax=Cerasicoccus frondis TaxID=490090 RepID=UPI002852847A|nr:ChuX/HutX family heme-like substrate-binding protein [Cerasicoccus frondis]
MTTTTSSLADRYAALKEADPKLRMRDCADRLGVTEGELVAADCGCQSIRLKVESWIGIIEELKALGRVMVLTRNEHCVHERKGCYEQISSHNGKIGLVVGKDIDLRLFFADWAHAYAVTAPSRGQELKSIQFFDRYGNAIHKVYPKEESKMSVYEELIARLRHEDQDSPMTVESQPAKKEAEPVDEERKEKFMDGWANLKDTHDFFMLMAKNKVSRLQAMELGEGKFTRRLENDAARRLLEQARDKEMPIMVFVGNDSAIQIHTGTVSKLVIFEDWFNVLDPDFNLHLKESGIASSWHVVKPTDDGDVNAVELYDAEGEIIAQFFGARKPGIPEREDWRELAAQL